MAMTQVQNDLYSMMHPLQSSLETSTIRLANNISLKAHLISNQIIFISKHDQHHPHMSISIINQQHLPIYQPQLPINHMQLLINHLQVSINHLQLLLV